VNAVQPSLRSAMDLSFDRRSRAMSAARRESIRQLVLVVVVVVVQALLILGVVASTLGLGREGVGPGRLPEPVPLPAGASRGGFASIQLG
jgi:hypothetical protein